MKKVTLSLMVVLIAVVVPMVSLHAKSANSDPIKIGVLIPLTGIFAESGRVVDMGLKQAFDEVGYQVCGREVKLIIEDTEGKAATALTKAKKLVESDRVALLCGTHSSSAALAVREYVEEMEIPLIIPSGAVASQISFEKLSKWVYRGSTMSAQYIYGLATYLHDVLGYKRAVTMAPDYVYGKESLIEFKKEFEKAGGEVIQEMLLPFPTMDFAPFLAKIDKRADCVFAEFAGADGVRLVKQYKEYGMWNKYPLTGSGIILEETLNALGDAAIGIVGSMNYSYNLDTPINKKFVAEYEAKYGERPGHVSPSAYEVGKSIIMALDKIQCNTKNKTAFIQAIADTDFDGPRGRFRFEKETHSVINTVYIRKVIKKDGELTFEILKTIPDVKASDIRKLIES